MTRTKRTLVVSLTFGVVAAGGCRVDEEGELRTALDAYVETVDSIAPIPRTQTSLAQAIDSAATFLSDRVRITGIRLVDGNRSAIARRRDAPTLACAVRLANSGSSTMLRPSEREPATCEEGREALMKAALWEFAAARRKYLASGEDRGPASELLSIGIEDLHLAPPEGITTTILTSSREGTAAITTHDASPDLVCGIRLGLVRAPLREMIEPAGEVVRLAVDPTCTRDSVVTAKAHGRPPPRDTLAAVSHDVLAVGGTHACVLTAGTAICWGNDRFGQLGDGVTLGRERAARVGADVELRSLAAGYAHTCGIDDGGRAYCWGANARGELGDGTFLDRATPVAVVGERRFVSLAAGPGLSCGMTADGAVYCWGLERPTPQAISSEVRFRAFASSFCGLSVNDVLYCWLDAESPDFVPNGLSWGVARAVPTAERFRTVSDGYGIAHLEDWWPDGYPEHDYFIDAPGLAPHRTFNDISCGSSRDASLLCWEIREQFTTRAGDSISPVTLATPSQLRTLVAGARRACGLDANGTAYCWSFHDGRRDPDAPLDRPDPVRVGPQQRFRSLAAYGSRTCGATESGAVLCWDDADAAPTPAALTSGDRVRALAAGLPALAPRDTSEQWQFTLPEGLDVRFRGRTTCDAEGDPVREGPDQAPQLRIGFASPSTTFDSLTDYLGPRPAWVLLGGFRWRVVAGDVMVRVPILDEAGNPAGQDAFDYISLARGAIYHGANACALVLEAEVESDEEREVLLHVARSLRFPISADSGSVAANARGIARYRAREHAQALAEFKRAATLDDQNVEAVNNAGFALYHLGRLEESVPWYRRAIELDPGRAVAFLNLGDSLDELGYHLEAIEAYARYLELDPNGTAAERVREIIRS